MAYDLVTRNGHNMYDMASMLQKAIRRNDIERASYAAIELFGNFHTYLWKRLLVISAEDCYGIMTKEIIGLKLADDEVNKGKKGYDKETLFIAKAVTLLCMARKNRDACYVACNFMTSDTILNEDEIEHIDITKSRLNGEIPDWVFDCHTLRGKKMGRTDIDMIISEQQALQPLQIGLFDDASWEPYYEHKINKGNCSKREIAKFNNFKAGKERNPQKDNIIPE